MEGETSGETGTIEGLEGMVGVVGVEAAAVASGEEVVVEDIIEGGKVVSNSGWMYNYKFLMLDACLLLSSKARTVYTMIPIEKHICFMKKVMQNRISVL